jgi:amidase
MSNQANHDEGKLSRRKFLQRSAAASLSPALLGGEQFAPLPDGAQPPDGGDGVGGGDDILEASIADLQQAMADGQLTAREITRQYIARIKRIDTDGPSLRSVLEVNPDALEIAAALDEERRTQGPRGPLHGIPILLKDNIDTADQMLTTAGSLALVGSRPTEDATVAQRLRDAGAVLLGKTNLSEWANFRSTQSSSGWSGRGRQCRNPYVLDRNPCGSSSGSAIAVAASLAAAALGTETDGSIVCPSATCGVVGIKPTLGLTSRAGVIPIAESQDTVGTHGRTVADAAAVLGALVGVDPRDAATGESEGNFYTDYIQFLDPNALQGARIGVPRGSFWGYSPEADAICEAAIEAMRAAGATIVDPADIPSLEELNSSSGEFEVLLYEFKDNLNRYLATRVPNERYPNQPALRTLAEIIAFNDANADVEMPYFGQEIFLLAQEKGPLTEQAYLDALANNRRLGREEGIDKVMNDLQLDALVAPTGSPAWPTDVINGDHFLGGSSSPAAVAGYPLISVPAGYSFGLPVGLTFMGRAYSEPTLIKLAYAFEQATNARRAPTYRPTLNLP